MLYVVVDIIVFTNTAKIRYIYSASTGLKHRLSVTYRGYSYIRQCVQELLYWPSLQTGFYGASTPKYVILA